MVLNQSISTPAGARIYMQNGEVISRSKVKQARPFCYLFINRPGSELETAFSVVTDRFKITSSNKRINYSGYRPPKIQLATFGGFPLNDKSEQVLLSCFNLKSELQPAVLSLNCGIWAVPSERRHLSFAEVGKALGGIISFAKH